LKNKREPDGSRFLLLACEWLAKSLQNKLAKPPSKIPLKGNSRPVFSPVIVVSVSLSLLLMAQQFSRIDPLLFIKPLKDLISKQAPTEQREG
jgi:hypothetical protein